MKKLLCIILASLMLVLSSCGVPNQAKDAVLCKDAEGNYYVLSADGKTFLYYYPKNESESFVVPEGVVTVSSDAFKDAALLKELSFSHTVRRIEDGLFELSTLERIVIPATVEYVKYDFYNCTALKELVCEAPMLTFNAIGCSSLEYLVLPETVTSFDEFCFEGCSALLSIKTVGQETRENTTLEDACAGKILYIPDGITAVSVDHLLGTGAEGFYIPSSVEELNLCGTGSWGRPLVISVASTTTVLTDDDNYHVVIVRD